LLGDKWGRRPMMVIFALSGMLAFYPLMKRLEVVTAASEAILYITVALLIIAVSTSISAIVKAELFPASVRSLGVSFPYAMTVALFGGTAEYVALWFKNNGNPDGFYYYMTFCMAITLVSSLFIPSDKERLHL